MHHSKLPSKHRHGDQINPRSLAWLEMQQGMDFFIFFLPKKKGGALKIQVSACKLFGGDVSFFLKIIVMELEKYFLELVFHNYMIIIKNAQHV